jgi:hypothetical protein
MSMPVFLINKLLAMPKPSPSNYPAYFQRYVDAVPEEGLAEGFQNQEAAISNFIGAVTEEKSMFAYAPGKWTLKELFQHVIDTERIFAYRALCFARGEQQNLPGFDEDGFAANSNANSRSWASLAEEMKAVRQSTVLLFKSFSPEVMANAGKANNNHTTVDSIGFMVLGHFYHHKKIVGERYF